MAGCARASADVTLSEGPSAGPLSGDAVSNIDELKVDIERLSDEEAAELFRWLSEKEWENWDEQMKADSQSGRLDLLVRKAVEQEAKGPLNVVPENEFLNYYKCPDDGTEWTMIWSCMCDDRCPKCNSEIEPYMSQDWPPNSLRPPAGND